jgi:predicted RNase H-like HicB family nuclease
MNSLRSSTFEPDSVARGYFEVTHDDAWTGHALDLPGCVAFGTSLTETQDALASDVTEYYEWLRSHGERVDDTQLPRSIEVVETARDVSPERKSGEAVALFSPELEPVTDDLIERVLTLLRYCQSDFEALLRDQPAGVLNHRFKPENRSAIEIARHSGQAECWYLTRVDPDDDPEIAELYQRITTEDPLIGLRAVLDTAEERFRSWNPEQRSERFVPQHNSRYGTEPWTARKVLRRFIEHRREHLDELERTVAFPRK